MTMVRGMYLYTLCFCILSCIALYCTVCSLCVSVWVLMFFVFSSSSIISRIRIAHVNKIHEKAFIRCGLAPLNRLQAHFIVYMQKAHEVRCHCFAALYWNGALYSFSIVRKFKHISHTPSIHLLRNYSHFVLFLLYLLADKCSFYFFLFFSSISFTFHSSFYLCFYVCEDSFLSLSLFSIYLFWLRFQFQFASFLHVSSPHWEIFHTLITILKDQSILYEPYMCKILHHTIHCIPNIDMWSHLTIYWHFKDYCFKNFNTINKFIITNRRKNTKFEREKKKHKTGRFVIVIKAFFALAVVVEKWMIFGHNLTLMQTPICLCTELSSSIFALSLSLSTSATCVLLYTNPSDMIKHIMFIFKSILWLRNDRWQIKSACASLCQCDEITIFFNYN